MVIVTDILTTNTPSNTLIDWVRTTNHEIARQNLLSLVARLKINASEAILEAEESRGEETKLATQFLQGDTNAFDTVYHQNHAAVTRVVARTMERYGLPFDLGSVEDVVAETFISLWLHRDRLEKVTDIPSYLIAIARNRSVDLLKSTRYRIAYERITPESATIKETGVEVKVILAEILGRLPEVERKIIEKIYIEGKTAAEVAEELELPRWAIDHRRVKAVRSLREQLTTAGLTSKLR